jgi:hypothetical protein
MEGNALSFSSTQSERLPKVEGSFCKAQPKKKRARFKGRKNISQRRDPGEILTLTEWADLAKAREFSRWGNPDEIRESAGLTDDATVYFLEEVDAVNA